VTSPPTVMRSSGGLIGPHAAAQLPASVVLSGPAGGVVAAAAFGTALGRDDLVSFDMGGTSTDVCRIVDGRPAVMFERPIGGLPNRMPSVAIHTVGAGGGSVAWVDAGGALRVGPHSAGAVPGPAAYGLGGVDATVTDANVVMGRIAPASSSALSISDDLARAAIAHLGEELGLSPAAVAGGVIAVVESHMERAVRVVSVDEGADPRTSTLVAFGGAGGLHAAALARRLGMDGVIVPPHAGVFSALGLLLAPPRSDVVVGGLIDVEESLDAVVENVISRARTELEGTGSRAIAVEASVDVRYRGQSHETPVSYRLGSGWSTLSSDFHAAHADRNGFSRPDDPIEVLAVRAAATGTPALTIGDLPEHRASGDAARGTREVLTDDGMAEATVWWRDGLEAGSEIEGPAIIDEAEATTFLGPDDRARVHGTAALEISWR
jgi:N-methylhydantoinase A